MMRRILVGLTVVGVWGVANLDLRTPVSDSGVTLHAAAPQVSVVRRGVIGGFVEGITYLTGGPHKGFVAMVAGSRVLGLNPSSTGRVKPVTLFNLTTSGPRFRANGIAYIDALDRYAVDTREDVRRGWPQHIYLFDRQGRVEQWPVVRGAWRRQPDGVEGLAYVPATATGWPESYRGQLLMVAEHAAVDPVEYWLEALTPDPSAREFHVTSQIVVPSTVTEALGSVVVRPGEALVAAYDGTCRIHRTDPMTWIDGTDGVFELAGTMSPCPADGIGEGIAALPDGSLVVVDAASRLHFLPADPTGSDWIQTRQVDVEIGLTVTGPSGIAWDSRRDRFLVKHLTTMAIAGTNAVGAVNLPLTEWTPLRVLSTEPATRDRNFTGITYNAETDEAVLSRAGRFVEDFLPIGHPPSWNTTRTPGLLAFPLADATASPTFTDLSPALKTLAAADSAFYNPNSWNNGPTRVTRNSADGTYLFGVNSRPNNLYWVSGDGATAGLAFTIPGATICGSDRPDFQASPLAYVPSGDQYIAQGTCRRLPVVAPGDLGPPLIVLLDASGLFVASFDLFTSLGTWNSGTVTAITSGPQAGAFAFFDNVNHEIIVFRIR